MDVRYTSLLELAGINDAKAPEAARLFRGLVEKFMGRRLEKLAPLAAAFFELVRIIAFSSEVARKAKRSTWFDDRIAFLFSDEGQFGGSNYYPKQGGIGQWIPFVAAKLQAAGVDLRIGETATAAEQKDGRTLSATLRSGETLAVDQLL